MKYHITCLAYGQVYSDLFIRNFVKSMMDESNLPALKAAGIDVTFTLYTDKASSAAFEKDTRLHAVEQLVKFEGVCLKEKFDFNSRYSALHNMTVAAVAAAHKEDAVLSVLSADMVFGKGFFKKMLDRYAQGNHDAIFSIPLRSAFEAVQPVLDKASGALDSNELFNVGYNGLHPLWVASHWGSPTFSKIPYCLLWNTGRGLNVRAFSISPLLFKPYTELINTGTLDLDAPQLFKNPYWAENWDEAPCIGAEPLFCFYPPFSNQPSNAESVTKEFAARLHPTQIPYLRHVFYYPNKEVAGTDHVESSGVVAEQIINGYNNR